MLVDLDKALQAVQQTGEENSYSTPVVHAMQLALHSLATADSGASKPSTDFAEIHKQICVLSDHLDNSTQALKAAVLDDFLAVYKAVDQLHTKLRVQRNFRRQQAQNVVDKLIRPFDPVN